MTVFITHLADDAVLGLSGPDVPGFLQGQLTCDVRDLSSGRSVPGALCTPQGRVVSDGRLLQFAEGIYGWRTSRDILAHTAEVLGKYAPFSRTKLDSDNSSWQVFGCWGENAAQLLKAVLDVAPSGQNLCVSAGNCLVVQADAAGEAYECYVNSSDTAGALGELIAQAQRGDEREWQSLEMERGLLRITAGQEGRHLPQALNYDLAGLISFRKGCYTGQEVVARLHYRGQSKRRAHVYRIAGGTGFDCPDTVFTADGERVGEVIRATHRPGDNAPVLEIVAVVRTAADPDTLYLGSPDGLPLGADQLPYTALGS